MIGLLLAVGLGVVHIFASQSEKIGVIPQRWWISVAGGVSIAYIFLDIFPELSKAQEELEHSTYPLLGYLENHIYLLALVGLAIFYGLEKLALRSRTDRRGDSLRLAIGSSLSH
jgi:xanthine/uracil/vitamin C permease (AzgA family)